MEENKRFSCFLIGADTLLIECGEILLQDNHNILGVITGTRRIADWAASKQLQVLPLQSDYHHVLAQQPFDYLFSITHLELIPDDVLALPQQLAVNFHDGPLPRYAGLNAPAWAIMQGETNYAITWHVITTEVDTGDILKQKFFDITPDETTLSLNTKCFATALETFPELITDLASGNIQRQSQDNSARSYFGKYKRPPAAGVLDWNQTAIELEALVRSLNFGPYANPLGSAKLLTDNQAALVLNATASESEPDDSGNTRPGQILAISDTAIQVATADGILSLNELSTLTGETISPPQFATQCKLAVNQRLPSLAADEREHLEALNKKLCRTEDFWQQRLHSLEPIEIAYASSATSDSSQQSHFAQVDYTIPALLSQQTTSELYGICIAGFAVLLSRHGRKDHFDLTLTDTFLQQQINGFETLFADSVPLHVEIDASVSCQQLANSIKTELAQIAEHGSWLHDLIARHPDLNANQALKQGQLLPVGIALLDADAPFSPPQGSLLHLLFAEDKAQIIYNTELLTPQSVAVLSNQLTAILESITAKPERPVRELGLLSAEEQQQVLYDWNQTARDFPHHACVHQLFETQVSKTPDAIALVFENQQLTYQELNQHANRLAQHLLAHGIGPDSMVGVHVERSLELMIATLAVLKAGGAYVPLDPAFPRDRIAYMIEDANLPVIITQQSLEGDLPASPAQIVLVDEDRSTVTATNPETNVTSDNLAYVIYTSGSTGRPKGVMVEHRNVVNFFTGMDERIVHDAPGAWLAVTSLSFDISVLELFWTLARGFKVVIYQDRDKDTSVPSIPASVRNQPMEFGLFMWGNDDAPGREKYRLMLEGAKYFDENGFDSVWTPERHFHAFGGPYPNPAVTGAAIAAVTNNISIRAGSCVSPLHHPVRIAEEWAVVDNLSNGRVGLSFASGWQPNDFVIKPENHKNNKAIMLEQIEIVQKLWRGEKVAFKNPLGDMVETATLPRPVQKELPFWVTTAGNPETYKQAGATGANVLTHLLGQSVDEVTEKIAIYRKARAEAGLDPAQGKVSLMLHTFVGEDDDAVREIVRQPMKDYLGSAMKLVLDFAWSFPAFKRPGGSNSTPADVDIKNMEPDEVDAILEFAFERYFETSGLFGTPQTCLAMIDRCKQAGVDEIACLLDFGVPTEQIMASLPLLKQVRDQANQSVATDDEDYSLPAQIKRHQVTHLQCTPSMARMMTLNDEARGALSSIQHMMVGGEAFPPSVAKELNKALTGTLTNMYGPTETTIWSTTQPIQGEPDVIPIGRPIANTQIYILDQHQQPLPAGIPGELYIGGDGVVRGYLNRPELTAERFISNSSLIDTEQRIYWTGDLACYRSDGVIDYLGRIDHQVKVRGYRIELGEIEALLEQSPGIREAVVILREDVPGDQRLVAYFTTRDDTVKTTALRELLNDKLPDYMLPSDFIKLESMPLTPNGKIDRNSLLALSAQGQTQRSETEYTAPESELETTVANLWQQTLGHDRIGVDDNFFDLGGHSLLIVRLHRELRKALEQPVSLTDLYRFPTIRSFINYITSDGSSETLKQSADRAQRRREMMQRRRRRNV